MKKEASSKPDLAKVSWSNAIDVLRIVAMVMVINLHTILSFTERPDFFLSKIWWALEPIIALSKPAVIIFFMLSGYLVLNKSRSVKENLQKTWRRLIVPLLVFEVFNFIVAWIRQQPSGVGIGGFVGGELERLVSHPSSPLWFLVVLTFLYLLNPLWTMLFEKLERREIAKYVTGFFFVLPIIAFMIAPLLTKNNQMYTSLTSWLAFVGFYLYGGLARKKWTAIENKKRNWLFLGVGFVLTVVSQFLAGWLQVSGVENLFWQWLESVLVNIGGIGVGLGVFGVLINFDWLRIFKKEGWQKKWLRFTKWLAGLSFGIYLIHPQVINFLHDVFNFTFDNLGWNVVIYCVVNWGLVFGLSLILTMVIKKIPGVKKIIGE